VSILKQFTQPSFISYPYISPEYFTDPTYYQLELKKLFNPITLYYGHELMIPYDGDYQTMGWMQNTKLLKRDKHDIRLLSNICRHRQAIMKQGRGNEKYIICNIHNWIYNNQGTLIATPLFKDIPCLHLKQTPTVNWHGLILDAQCNIPKELFNFDFPLAFKRSDYQYYCSTVKELNVNWKSAIENYFNISALKSPVDNTQGGDNFLLQKWTQKEVGSITRLHYYPNLMIESYPSCLAIHMVIPKDPQKCTLISEFFYPDKMDSITMKIEYDAYWSRTILDNHPNQWQHFYSFYLNKMR